mgnify:CR=1 FL=1
MDIVHQGAVDRFRPILITSFSTVAGLLPLAYGLGGSDPFIAPMALAIGYGLLFSRKGHGVANRKVGSEFFFDETLDEKRKA